MHVAFALLRLKIESLRCLSLVQYNFSCYVSGSTKRCRIENFPWIIQLQYRSIYINRLGSTFSVKSTHKRKSGRDFIWTLRHQKWKLYRKVITFMLSACNGSVGRVASRKSWVDPTIRVFREWETAKTGKTKTARPPIKPRIAYSEETWLTYSTCFLFLRKTLALFGQLIGPYATAILSGVHSHAICFPKIKMDQLLTRFLGPLHM